MIKDIVYFAKVRPDAIIPSKAPHNAGYDIYICSDEENIIINPHETKMLPTGIASVCTEDTYFQLFERGSGGIKGIGQRSGVIDSSYRGEWFIPITNHNMKPLLITKEQNPDVLKILEDDYIVYPMMKAIAQAVRLYLPTTIVQEISYDELKEIPSERNLGCLGSSNK